MGMFGVCGECMGARGCARVGTGMHGVCAGMHRCLWMRAGVQGGGGVHGVGVCGQVWPSVHR